MSMDVSAVALSKYIAAHGGYSRRKAADLIKLKQVKVNGATVRKPYYVVSESDDVRIQGVKVVPQENVYVLLNKPGGVITTMADQTGRPSVADLIADASQERLFPVGRLDKDTTGLLVCTNDGELAHRLAHPKFMVAKEYAVTLHKPVQHDHLMLLTKGLYLKDGYVRCDRAVFAAKKKKFVVIVTLHSGKKRVIRRMFGKLGYEVRQLDRTRYAGLSQRNVKPGGWRYLTAQEVARLSVPYKSTKDA